MVSTFRHLDPSDTPAWRAAGLRYYGLNFFYRQKFGARVRKLSLDAGCNCPNRDGTLATLGCIFCSPESFSPSRRMGPKPIADQLSEGTQRLRSRYDAERFIAYFQPGTNTYGPMDRLLQAYQQALSYPDVVGLAIGTRPDCVGEDVLDVLTELAQQTWLVVEYGLQTVHDRTLDLLNRGHHYDAFLDAYRRTRRRKIQIGVHVILGLPGESHDDLLATARQLASLEIHSVKLHNLYAVRNTVLADEVAAGRIRLADFQQYVGWAVDFLEELPGSVVIDRLSGDAPPGYLVGAAMVFGQGGRSLGGRDRVSASGDLPGLQRGRKMIASALLEQIGKKVEAGQRLSSSDGEFLFSEAADLHVVGQLADLVRRRKNGDAAYYNLNLHINPTNVCLFRCRLCAYSRDEADRRAYVMSPAEILARGSEAEAAGCTELHVVGGVHPQKTFDWYLGIIRDLHAAFPRLHLKAWTAVEIDHFARIAGRSARWVLEELIAAGLGSMPGGGGRDL